jgi:hypothetical protein
LHPFFFERGIARSATKEISSCCVEYCPGEEVVVSLFQIPVSQLKAFEEREHEFRFTIVNPIHFENHVPLNIQVSDFVFM